jgi:hypothetical protein
MPYESMSPSITRPTADNYHALLFVGVCNVQRYVLSLNRWATLLHEMYGYPLANIRILVGAYSTASWGLMPAGTEITYNATRTDLDDALAAYASGSGDPHELSANDSLFIFTFNHGGNDNDGLGSYLCCENFATNYYASDLATRISAIQCRQIVLYAAQCMSGGFLDPFINALAPGTRGAVITGCRAHEVTWEAISDKLFASAFNGRMVQDPADDNIDLGITGDGMGVYLVPGYHTNRIDWGPTGAISTREAFNWVYDHYINHVRSALPSVAEVPLYRQKPWTEAGQPIHIRLGEPDLVMQDNDTDTGEEPSTGSPWYSPDLYVDNTDQFPTAGQHQYVPAHDNRFFVRTANRGTAPTDDMWRVIEVRGLGFTGGPVGPPRIDRAVETSGTSTVSARLRPGRAQTQFQRILIGDDFGHGCVSAAAWCGTNLMDHDLWNIQPDNDQAQCNFDPAAISGTVPVGTADTNANAGRIVRTVPVVADRDGTFELRTGKASDLPIEIKIDKPTRDLKKGETAGFALEVVIRPGTKDGLKGSLPVFLLRNRKNIGGWTFVLTTATAFATIAVCDERGRALPAIKVSLTHPGDPRRPMAPTDKQGIANFGPLNPGFYFVQVGEQPPTRILVEPGRKNAFQLVAEKRERRPVEEIKKSR